MASERDSSNRWRDTRRADSSSVPGARQPPVAKTARQALLHPLQHLAGNHAVAGMVQRSLSSNPARAADSRHVRGPGPAEGIVALPEEAEAPGLDQVSAPGSAAELTGRGAAAGISSPAAVSWAARDADEGGAQALAGPSVATLTKIQAPGGGNPRRVGWTSFPLATAKAPQFDFGVTSSTPPGGGATKFAATPSWRQHFNEGDSVCWFLAAGRHKTTLLEGGKPVYWNLSAAISARDSAAELEHSADIKQARDISIKEAEDVLKNHIIGKTFPSAGTAAQAKQHVLTEITAKLTHAGLGNDQSKWAATYERLYRKTLQRDNKGWHTFGLGNRKTNKAGDVDYDLTNGTTNVGTTTSAKLIVY